VRVSGRQILVDGQPLHIKGICWSPTTRGQVNNANFGEALGRDLQLMKQAGINAIRTYGFGITRDTRVLDAIAAEGMWVIPTVYSYGGEDAWKVTDKVNRAKGHRAILMWSIGNEWNYNGIYVGLSHGESIARINQVAGLVKRADPERLVSSVYGDVPSTQTLMAMPLIDVWGINSYRGISFGGLMSEYSARSSKPMYLGEYGADAYNANVHTEDQQSQAIATTALTQEILTTSAASGGICSGGFLFEFSDEWWKDNHGSAWEHDVGGVAPGGGPYPDQTFNEEWWGIVDIDRVPRMAFQAYADIANPNRAPAP